ncbi:ABC transporter permease [Streptomyces rapamycinicus]|uniref:ABC transporter permease n=2 Tax=Streptomyces rapamycinicus TaxID=1226757 RepID=A0A0A0NGP8_STRRN|nr:ABC transporter permease [Streptomyces rapamycinicus]AGP55243.1 ABC transporter permease [Streptomyces rapamycinicus NRRL 5491]MBB4782784.1 oligopeptide transport system permease protein [Streptomyces rapamycinicus]RLV81735.1 ABC transporter permease [Streptomyces rapamycinicus NRRL 5491]UTO63258.1 ABC transporter permease [Streptomyces rapamycinicus]UTP31216.1 ABC transporter permease [Streptomyces rapamycinicus NRRL 5491]
MGRYVARRLLQMIPVFIGTTLIIFLMVHVLPGDPIRAMWGDKAADPAQVASLRHEFGLDKPLWQQYIDYMVDLFKGDFGKTFGGRQVSEEMGMAFPVTLRLAAVALTIEIIVGIGLGAWAGLRAGRAADTGVLIFTLIVISMPVFVLGYLARFIFADELGWLPPNVQDSMNLQQLLLPGFVLAMLSMAYVARLTRTTFAENLRADYMRTALAKGLPRRRIVGVHLLRNSLIPVVTFLGTDVGALVGGAVVTEGIFNVQGVGNLLFKALGQREGTTIVGVVTIFVLVILLINLLVDLLYAVLDPRIRYA